MAIVKMEKFHLLTLESQREELLRELQLFRSVQFEDVYNEDDFDESVNRFRRPTIDVELSEMDDEMNRCNHVIDLIGKYTVPLTGLKGLIKGLPNYTFEEMEKKVNSIDYDKEYNEVKKLGDNLSSIESKVARRRELIKELEPISNLDVSFKQISGVKRFDVVIGGVSGKIIDIFKDAVDELEYTYCEEIGVYKDDHYFFIISDKREEDSLNEALRIGNFNRIKLDLEDLPKDNISRLNSEIENLEKTKSEIISELASKTDVMDDFKLKYEYIGNLRVRSLAKKDFMETSSVCFMSGYCPKFEEKRFEQSISKVCGENYSIEYEEVDKDSMETPVLLKNNRFVRIFSDITETYALPKYNEIDPTPLYAPIYALFFGMMSADAGYGATLILLATLGLKFCNLTPHMKKYFKFFQLIGVMTVVWGVLYGSYFGASIPGMWKLFDLSKQFMTILVMSIIIGGIHLYYALGIRAYMQIRDHQYADMFFDVIAWYITLTGIIVVLLSLAGVLPKSIFEPSKYVMIVGLILLVIGGARASSGGIAKRLVAGLYNVYGISGYIGDFVSYSRLMALGMSGGYIALSINMIAGMVWGKTVIGYVAAIVILLFFHAFNLFLTCLGAYVHALRLIYVEFFGKFYEGGGKGFRFFRNKTKYINLDRQFED